MPALDAIVLATSPYRETTLIVSLLTRSEGVIRVLARGARRKGKVQAAFEAYAWVRGEFRLPAASGKLGTAGDVGLVKSWDYLRRDLARLAYAGVGLETLGRLAEEAPPEPYYFEEACRFLTVLEDAAGPGSVLVALLLRLLHHAGFPPHPGEGLDPAAPPATCFHHFATHRLEIARPEPDRHDGDAHRYHVMPLSGEMVRAIGEGLRRPPPLDGSWQLPARPGREALTWLIRVWEDHLNHVLKSAEFLERMVLGSRARRGPR
ncbi:MAG TPA: DNA repair protein RecO [Candidatus Sumerlaeota bacterium]|nr:DNA repair protein RecO [Candidatus Sumerlaeota bacterium]